MCGISGIINKNNQPVLQKKIKEINNLAEHRGPDGEGYYFGNHFAFGHRRLSIIDLSDAGSQPMHYMKKYTITYNGEIYNYKEIKNELSKFGYSFRSGTDTEVILASYDRWGSDCVKRFNGMWAFSIYDRDKNILFCKRDRFGIKPFYFTENNDFFAFGSEIKQLLPVVRKKYVNKNVLIDYLLIGYEDHSNETFFEDIFKLEQSCNLIYDLNLHKYKIEKYYQLKFDKKVNELNEKASVDIFKKTFTDSVNLRLRSDVKVGTCLSGGLDSSAVATLASKKYKNKELFTAIHGKSHDKNKDESYYAEKVAKKSNLNLKFFKSSNDLLVEKVDKLINLMEEPFGGLSSLMQLEVMNEAKNNNLIVLLDGQGGDEILLGYERYFIPYLNSLSFFEKIKNYFYIANNSKLGIFGLFKYWIYFSFPRLRINFLIFFRSYFLKKEYIEFAKESFKHFYKNNSSKLFDIQSNEIFKSQLPHLLRYADKVSMFHSIESRLPFLDYRLVEVSVSLNKRFKIYNGWSKYVLREAMNKDLDKDVCWRKNKFGFEAPLDSWENKLYNSSTFKQAIDSSKIIKKLINKTNIDSLNNRIKWRLYNIAKWEQFFKVDVT